MLTLLPAVDVADGKAVRLLQGEVGDVHGRGPAGLRRRSGSA